MTPTERNAVLEEAALWHDTEAARAYEDAATCSTGTEIRKLRAQWHEKSAAHFRSLKTPDPVPGETDGWRSMDSAPRDGTEILLWGASDADGPSAYKVAMWDSVHRKWIEPWDAPHVHEAPDSYALIGFTHWQPIPSPPRVVTP